MRELLNSSSFFSVALTIGCFSLGSFCQQKWKKAVFNPIIIGAALVMLVLTVADIPVETYQENTKLLTWLMTPATICLAISFAEQIRGLKQHLPAVLAGVLAGTVCSIFCVAAMSKAFGLSEAMTWSLLPKSVTTAIGVALSEQAGGIAAISTVAIVITGVLGNAIGPTLAKVLKITDPVAQGVAFGTSSHVIGTTKALELSPVAGAVSSMSLTLAGLLTSVVFSFLMSI